MQGYRTLAAAGGTATFLPFLLQTVIAPMLAAKGVTLTPDAQVWITGVISGAVMAGMRLITRTPVFAKDADAVAAAPPPAA
jgi:hypothetical protein